jgi:RPA family protein
MVTEESSKRQVAYKVEIADVLNNNYVKEEGWLPNYVAVGDKKVSRVNLLGVIVSKNFQEEGAASQNFILDDGSGRISLRFFEPGASVDVGDVVVVVGRPREFGAERYIVPEIIKKIIEPKWVKVRKLELALEKQKTFQKKEPVAEELSVETEDLVDDSNPLTKIISIIKELDAGAGVGFEEISVKLGTGDADAFVKKLLEQGDIFEVKPGRYKVLE